MTIETKNKTRKHRTHNTKNTEQITKNTKHRTQNTEHRTRMRTKNTKQITQESKETKKASPPTTHTHTGLVLCSFDSDSPCCVDCDGERLLRDAGQLNTQHVVLIKVY